MNICIKTHALQGQKQTHSLLLQDRLPSHIIGPCDMTCDFYVTKMDEDYLLTLELHGEMTIICQRCLNEFQHAYDHHTQLAICFSEANALSHMKHYECIVTDSFEVSLTNIVIDDLFLYSPEKHENSMDCTSEMCRFIGGQDEILSPILGLKTKTR